MIWLSSDSHYGHANIIKLCNRPFTDLHHMNKTLTDNWNKCVQPHDIAYDMGDFSFNKKYHVYEDNLNGKIFHIKGNHDRVKWVQFAQLEYNDHVIWFQHRPPEHLAEIGADVDLVICGHVHNHWVSKVLDYPDEGRCVPVVNVGVDVWDFQPVSLDRIISEFLKD